MQGYCWTMRELNVRLGGLCWGWESCKAELPCMHMLILLMSFFFSFSTESASSEFTKWRKWKERPVRKRKQVTKDFSECFVTTYFLPRNLIFLAVFFSRARRSSYTIAISLLDFQISLKNVTVNSTETLASAADCLRSRKIKRANSSI